jgi:hypothetical protein
VAVSPPAPVPDRQVNGLKVSPEPSAEAARGTENGVHIGSAIEQKRGKLVQASADGSMERGCSSFVPDVDETRIRVEQTTDFVRVLARDRLMNGMSAGSGQDTTATIPLFFEESRDLGMTPFARHIDQAAIMQSVPFRIGACVEQQADRIQVSLANGEMDCRGVPVLSPAESRVSCEQESQRVDVAVLGRGESIPDHTSLLRIELGRLDQRPGGSAND